MIEIRNAQIEDADTIIAFNQQMAWETESRKLDPAIIGPGVKAILNDASKGFYVIAIEEGEILGQLMITYEWSDWRNNTIWWIQSVYIHEDHRKRGIYKALYAEISARAKANGVNTIRLYVEKENTRAQQVYERLGMHECEYYMYEVTL